MKYASDFRRIARESLKGKWGIAIVAGIIASMLGAVTSSGPDFNFNFDIDELKINLDFADQSVFLPNQLSDLLRTILPIVLSGVILYAVVLFVVGSIISTGYAKFNLSIVDRKEKADLGDLFSYFSHWKVMICASLLKTLYIFLWSLLFIIPGIVAGYSYAMTQYILAENPQLTAGEALDKSKEMMLGNRWRLFCLQLSFIGWQILSALVFGIGSLVLTPYIETATAAFYREISGTTPLPAESVTDKAGGTELEDGQ